MRLLGSVYFFALNFLVLASKKILSLFLLYQYVMWFCPQHLFMVKIAFLILKMRYRVDSGTV